MVIATSSVGMGVGDVVHHVDARWTMAYAASLGETLSRYFDTTHDDGVVAHPVFAVCPEWPAIVASRDRAVELGVTAHEVTTSVHATHDTTIHRLVRPGDVLTTSVELVGMEQISPGAKSITRLHTSDANGDSVATTTQAGIYLGQRCQGPDRPDPDPPPLIHVDRQGTPAEVAVQVAAGAAHTYTEGARIWNPIHTNKAVALAAGLPNIILHGTANMAHGVSAVVALRANNDPSLVRRISCRFAAMVLMPSTMTVRVWPDSAHESGHRAVPFEVLNDQGQPAVKDGVVLLGEAA